MRKRNSMRLVNDLTVLIVIGLSTFLAIEAIIKNTEPMFQYGLTILTIMIWLCNLRYIFRERRVRQFENAIRGGSLYVNLDDPEQETYMLELESNLDELATHPMFMIDVRLR